MLEEMAARRPWKPARVLSWGIVAAIGLAFFSSPARSQQTTPHVAPQMTVRPQARITTALISSQRVTVPGSVLQVLHFAVDHGAVPDNMQLSSMTLVLTRSAEQEAELQKLLADQQNPGSANFHKWVTPQEFGEYFGVAQSDIDQVTGWLQSQGFVVKGADPGRQRIEFSGSAAQVRAAFGAEIHRFSVNGEEHMANAQEVSIPAAFAGVVAGVAKLNDFRPQPGIKITQQRSTYPPFLPLRGGQSSQTNGISATPLIYNTAATEDSFTPADYKSMYNVPGNRDGSGYKIGIPSADDPAGGLSNGGTDSADYEQFSKLFGLPGGHLTVLLPQGEPSTTYNEPSLDIQWAHALAPGAQIVFTAIPDNNLHTGVDSAMDYMVDNNLVDIIVESYAIYGTDAAFNQYVTQRSEQGAAQGVSIIVGSGDWGSGSINSSALATDIYTDNPYTTSVGGTTINTGGNDPFWWGSNVADYQHTTLGGHIPEDAWSGSGGGADSSFAKPDWQAGVPGIPNDNARDFPDVSLVSDPDVAYMWCLNGGCNNTNAPTISLAYGTSLSGPAFAGMVALLDQQYGGRQGLLNRSLYKLAASENWSGCNGSSQSTTRPPGSCVFYDITVGDNAVSGQPGFGTGSQTYNTSTGYDRVTGLGSVNASQLISSWGSVTYLPTTVSFTLPSTSFYGDMVPFSGTVTSSSGGTPTGFITLTTSAQSFGPYALDASGNFSGTVQGLSVGSDTVTANYGGDAQYASAKSSGQPMQVNKIGTTVAVNFSVPSLNTFGARTHTAVITVMGTTGYGRPGGQVHIYFNAASQGSSFQDFGIQNLGLSASNANAAEIDVQAVVYTAAPDTYTVKVDYLGDSIFNASPTSGVGSITIVKAASTLALTTSTGSATNGTSVTLTANFATPEYGAAPTGTVQFYQKGIAVGSPVALSNIAGGSVGGSGYTATATLVTTALLPGTDSITAIYSGDGNISGSTSSNPTSVTIAGYPTTVSLAADRTDNIFSGAAINLTATVFTTQPTQTVSGTVTYFVNGVNVGSAPVSSGTSGSNQKGSAVLLTAALPVGTDTINAVYNGDSHYNPGTSYSITVTVIPTVESAIVNPTSIDFGTVSVGSSSPISSVGFTNNGTEDIPLSGITIDGPNASSFSESSFCHNPVQTAGEGAGGCFTNVTFTPLASGTLTATLTFHENSIGGPHTVSLTGKGLPQGAYTSLGVTSLTFDNQPVTTTSDAKTVKLTNIGNAAMTGISFSLTAGSGNFTLDTSGCGTSLAIGASCTVSVRFAPSTTGVLTGTLSESDSSSTGNAISLTGTGTGIEAITLADAVHTVSASLNSPYDAIGDSFGNIYISDTAANKVYKIDSQGLQTTLPIIGLVSPMGMAMDSSGALYVVSNGGNHQVSVIKYVSPSSQDAITFLSATSGAGVAVDSGGNVYLADPSGGSVWMCSSSCTGAIQINVVPATLPTGIAIDASNNLYVSSGVGGSGYVVERPGVSGAATTLASMTSPVALAIAPDGSLYIGDQSTNKVYRYTGGTPTAVFSNAGITKLTGVHLDGASNLFVTSQANATVLKATASAARLDMGSAAVGSTRSITVNVTVPGGNSVSTIAVADNAGNSEWALPTGNTCTVSSGSCSFTLNFTPAYPGLRDGTLTITDSQSNTLSYILYGYGQAPEAVLLNGAKTTIAGTWAPTAIRSDSAGNIYVVDSTVSYDPVVQKITPAGGVSTIATHIGDGAITSIGIDADGTIAVRGDGGFAYVNGTTQFAVGGGGHGQLAEDSAGVAYFSINGSIYNANTALPFGSATSVDGMTLDADNNLYVTTSAPAVYKITPDGTTTKLLDNTAFVGNYLLQNPSDIGVDAGGAVWVADGGAAAVFRIDASGSATAFGLDFSSPSGIGLAITPQGVLYLADETNKAIYRYAPDSMNLSFGSVADQTSAPAQTVLMTNAGNLPLTLGNITMPSAYSGQYNETWCAGSSALSAGTNCNVTLVFNPQALGAQNGNLTFTDNSLNNSASTQTVALTGTSTVGAESALQFTSAPPSSISANGNLGTVAVKVVDAAGNLVTTATDALTLTVSGPATYTFNTSLVNGVATFNLTGTAIAQSGSYTVTVGTTTTTSVAATTPAIVTVNSLSQAILFNTVGNPVYGVAPLALAATASSGLGVTYTVTGPATISGSTLTVTGVGSVTVTAHQPGNSSYSAASDVARNFNVTPAMLTVTPNNVIKSFGAAVPPLTYTITGYVNGDAVEYPVVSGIPALSTSVTTLTPVGSYPITASLGTLTAANYTFQFGGGTMTITGSAPQTIVFDPLPDLPVRAASYRLTAFSTSGLPVSYLVTGPASISGSQLTVTGTGTVTVTASQAGNGSYTAATSVQQSFTAQ